MSNTSSSLLTKIGKDVIKYNVKPYLSDCEYITNNGTRCKNPYMAKFKDLQTGEIKECNMYCLKNSTPEMFRSMFTIPYMLTNINMRYKPKEVDYSFITSVDSLYILYVDGKFKVNHKKFVSMDRVLYIISNYYNRASSRNLKVTLKVYIDTEGDNNQIVGFHSPFIRPMEEWKLKPTSASLTYVS